VPPLLSGSNGTTAGAHIRRAAIAARGNSARYKLNSWLDSSGALQLSEKYGMVKMPTANEIELFIRLEDIFMPQARRQRDAAYKQGSAAATVADSVRFVHYTSAEAALRIIESKRVWMRNTRCMSDYSEVQHGFAILQKFFSDKANTEKFCAALDKSVPGAAMEGITLFNQWWAARDIEFNTYIASIAEHDAREDLHGRLSMWRAFGKSSTRVALVFNIPWSSTSGFALNVMFSPVAYLAEDQVHGVIREVVNNIETNTDFLCSVDREKLVGIVFNMLLAAVTCLKHEGFQEEREWRAIYSPNRAPSELLESSIEVIAGVPQTVYKIPFDVTVSSALADLDFSRIFDRLIIGPSQYGWPMCEAFSAALKKAGVSLEDRQRIFISGIPIRS
jgi:hypothetical protein